MQIKACFEPESVLEPEETKFSSSSRTGVKSNLWENASVRLGSY